MINKILLLIFISLSFLNAKILSPTSSFEASGGVTDLVYIKGNLYISTIEGTADIFNKEKNKIIKSIKVEKIKDFMGDFIKPKIYSIDLFNNAILLTTQGDKGYSNIYEYKDDILIKLISINFKKLILRAKYIEENKIIFATLGNQVYLYDIKKNKIIWTTQISQSKFSHFKLNESKDKVLVADESGDLKLIKVSNGKVIKLFSNKNLDNVFQVDFKNNKIITAGQDMRTVIYNVTNNQSYYKKGNFLIYSAGLSPKGKLAGFAKYENNDVEIFHSEYKTNLYTLTENKMNISNILFLNEKELYISSDDEKINYYKLK
jgi:hypothetical protein